jgi:hypothetical protein
MPHPCSSYAIEGFALISGILDPDECAALFKHCMSFSGRAGSRKLLSQSSVAALADRLRNHPLLASLLSELVPAQCTHFLKSPEANWLVAPHQDLSIPVMERLDAPGFSGWSYKEGMHFVQAPDSLLRQMVAVRIQLNSASSEAALFASIQAHIAMDASRPSKSPQSLLEWSR